MHHRRIAAFSLIELSIVLAILGLLVGGVMLGQSLMKAGALRSVTSEFQRFDTATQAFITKYNGLPGDLKNGIDYFGDNSTLCSDGVAGTDGTPGTCNGDGDDRIEFAAAANATGEAFQYWNQLALAGLIGGTYSGKAGSSTNEVIFAEPNTNAAPSRLKGGGWSTYFAQIASGNSYWYYLTDILDNSNLSTYGNVFLYGATASGAANVNKILTPTDAWDIDTKLDDGRPGTGKILGLYWNNQCAAPDSGGASNTNTNASYRLMDPTAQCALAFRDIF